jgi:hypothetical protein
MMLYLNTVLVKCLTKKIKRYGKESEKSSEENSKESC